jgi:hypothetical protein
VPLLGWAGIKNGALLERAQAPFGLLITMGNNLPLQQNLALYNLAVVALQAPSNRLTDTQPLMSKVLTLLPTRQKGQLVVISAE